MKYIILFVSLVFISGINFGQHKLIFPPEGNHAVDQRADIVFDNLTEKDGLSQNQVTSMVTDKYGYLWIGTSNGLNRYAGNKFDVFKKNRNDPFSLLNNFVYHLAKDNNGNLYGLTSDGVFQFNYASGNFKNFLWPKSDYILDPIRIEVINNLEVYVATGKKGLLKMQLSEGGTSQYFRQDSSQLHALSSDRISSMVLSTDRKGLWLTTLVGLNYLDFSTGKFKNYRNSPGNAIFNDHNLSSLCLSPEGHVWYMDNVTKKIIGFDPISHTIKYNIGVSSMMKIAYGGTLFESTAHDLYYSSISYEIIKIRYREGMLYDALKNDPANPASICGDYILSAWEDKDKTVWLGTIAGISRVNEERNFYRIVPLAKQFPELEQNNWQITCLVQNPYNLAWWIGSRDGKIYEYDAETGKSKSIDVKILTDNRNTSFFITDVEFINEKAIVCMSYGFPVELDLRTMKARIIYEDGDKLALFKPSVITQETDSTYLLSNNKLPILRWFPKSKRTEEINYPDDFRRENKDLPGNWLKAKKNKGAWVSSDKFLGFIATGSTTIVPHNIYRDSYQNDGDPQPLSGGFVNALELDSSGNAWFAQVGQGLYNLTKDTGKLSIWDSSDGLVSELLNSSLPDKSGRIWAASFNKFSIFDPQSNQFFNFKIELSNHNSFYYNYMMRLENEHIVSNIKGNLIEFFPEKIARRYPQNTPFISSVVLPSGKKLLWGQEKLVLKPEDNFITIHFGSLSDTRVYEYHFRYKMEGVNNDWVRAGSDAAAVYTNLSPGSYIFEVQAMSNDGNWKSTIKSMRLKIMTPFYKSWWFISLCLLTLISVITWIVLSRINHLRNINELKSKAQLLEKEKTAVMYENLKQHLNPHFLFNSLTSLSSLIRLDQKKAGDFLDKMSKVYRYILKNKENEVVPLSEEIKFVDLYNQLQKTRFGDGLSIHIEIPEEKYHRKIVPVTLQNLVENAIKHNIADEEEPLQIDIYIEGEYLIVKNNLRKKNYVETSNKQGLHSMISLYRFLSPLPLVVAESEKYFIVKIPLI